MTQKTVSNKELERLCTAFLELKDVNECWEFLRDLLTTPELRTISRRWEIIKKLNEGKTQREISGKLDCGISTVSRANAVLRDGTGALKLILDRLELKDHPPNP